MGRKRNPYLALYTRDILSSPRCRALSASAAGVYFFLLCRLNEPPTPGAYRLRDWEAHPNWQRSKTQQCVATADKYERLPFFASLLAKNDLPWKQKDILSGLQELYRYGIITVEGDMLVQPRMFKDNGFDLPDLDNDGAPIGTILDDPATGMMTSKSEEEIEGKRGVQNEGKKKVHKSAKISTNKGTKKERVSHAHAHTHLSVEYENNKDNSIGNKGVQGENTPYQPKTPKNNLKGKNVPSDGDLDVEEVIIPSGDEKPVSVPQIGKNGVSVADCPPTLEEIQQYMQNQGELGKPFRYITAEQFYDDGCQTGWQLKGGQPLYDWRARLRSLEAYRRSHGDKPAGTKGFVAYQQGGVQAKAGDPVAATPNKKNKYNRW